MQNSKHYDRMREWYELATASLNHYASSGLYQESCTIAVRNSGPVIVCEPLKEKDVASKCFGVHLLLYIACEAEGRKLGMSFPAIESFIEGLGGVNTASSGSDSEHDIPSSEEEDDEEGGGDGSNSDDMGFDSGDGDGDEKTRDEDSGDDSMDDDTFDAVHTPIESVSVDSKTTGFTSNIATDKRPLPTDYDIFIRNYIAVACAPGAKPSEVEAAITRFSDGAVHLFASAVNLMHSDYTMASTRKYLDDIIKHEGDTVRMTTHMRQL